METPTDPNIATCPTCGTLIDVSEQEPYAKIHCSSCGTWMRVRQAFANYEIQGVLGEGGQGMVYRGVDNKLKRPVAIKLMRREYSADPLFVKRFESEAKVTASLNHPNIVKVFSFGSDRGLLYLAMEMVDHGSLEALMAQLKKVPEERVLEVGIQIARGLQAGLEKGLIHRDIKPGNILFADEHTAKIVDFGLAVLVEKQHEEEGDVWATPYYVSPEKLDGQAEDFHSDMYSLAATLFHAIAGRPPFIAETSSMTELKKIKSKPTHLLSHAPHASTPTAFVLDKALSVKPQDRFASYEEFIHNMEYARNELRKRPKVPVTRRVVARNDADSSSWLTMLVVGVVLAGGLGYYFGRGSGNAGASQPTPGQTAPGKPAEKEDPDTRYQKARALMAKGKFRPAAATFRELYADGKLPEPRNSWAAVHEGLCELLDGRPVPARNAFGDLGRKIEPTALGLDPKLATFFSNLSMAAARPALPGPEDIEKFDSKSYEAIAFLALGLKAWEAGAHQQGTELLKRFRDAEPDGESAWINEFRPLIAGYLEEYAAYSATEASLAGYEAHPEAAAATLAKLPEVRAKIKTSALLAKLGEMERDLGPKITAMAQTAKSEGEKKMAERIAAEEQLLMDAKMRIKSLCETYRFKDALLTMQAVKVTVPDLIKERDLLVHRVQWLVMFKEQLVKDLNTSGYQAALQRRNGQQLTGGVARASDMQLDIKVQFGNVPIAWSDLTPQSVLAMARSFIKPTLPPDALADRQWQAGVFCIFTQLTNESQALMDEASTVKDEYRFHKALFFGTPEPDPSAPPAAPETPPAPVPDAAPGNGTEMADKPLNPSKGDMNESNIRGLRRPPQP